MINFFFFLMIFLVLPVAILAILLQNAKEEREILRKYNMNRVDIKRIK